MNDKNPKNPGSGDDLAPVPAITKDLTQVSGADYQAKAEQQKSKVSEVEEEDAGEDFSHIPPATRGMTGVRRAGTSSMAELARSEGPIRRPIDYLLLFFGIWMPIISVIGACLYFVLARF